jgi:adenosylmethionine-8-amino-7-oxononanoate aminotransferase
VEAIKELEQLLDDDDSILGVIVEPVLGSGGVIPLDSGYLRRLRELCTAREMYLIFDEVITGCGRTGSMLACHSLGFWPDAITLGKGLTSGAAALGAALLCPELAKAMGRIQDTSSTFAWTPSACCICAANLEVIEGEFLAAKADLLGHEFALRLQGVIDRAVPGRFELKSAGMMLGLWPNCEEQQRPRVIRRLNINAQRRGLFVGASWDWQSCVLLPPLTITRSECDIACEKLADALTST